MAQYEFKLQTRRLYPGPEEGSFSEAYDAQVFAEYNDEDPFLCTIASDEVRESVPNNLNFQQDHGGPVEARTVTQAVPAEGLVGSFFEVELVKTIPTSGLFKYHRMAINCIPGSMDNEHVAGGGSIRSGGIS